MQTMDRAAYMRARYASNPAARAASLRQSAAYRRAETRLRERYRKVFDRYYAEELAKI